MRQHHAIRFATAAFAAGALAGFDARAGVRRDDVADSEHTTTLLSDGRYHSVGAISFGFGGRGSGTLITPRWVLTAGHVVDSTAERRFNYGGTDYDNGTSITATHWFAHPNWSRANLLGGFDIGLVRLPTPITSITPASRFTGAELGRVGTMVGFGIPGTGSSGMNFLSPSKAKRAGHNMLDALGSVYDTDEIDASDNIIASDFDKPGDPSKSRFGSPLPLEREYSVASGDSGGGTFVDAGSRAYLAAVHSFIHAFPVEEGGDGSDNASYGDTFGSTRVTAFNEWIDDQIGNHWANGSGGSFSTGGNWSQGAVVPASGDVASLNLAGTYAINFAASATNERLLARRGDVTLNLGGATYTLASGTYEGSLVVGKYDGNDAAVTFAGGTVNTKDAVIAELAGSVGRVTVGSGATWNCSTDVYIGGAFLGGGGAGTVRVAGGGTLAVAGTMKIYEGGTLDLAGGAASAGLLRLSGGTIAGTGTFAAPIANESGAVDVPSATLTMSGALTSAAGATLTKTGAGTLVLAGAQSHGAGASLDVAAGAARLDTDAGANLLINVDPGATAQFNTTQHLAALDIASGASASLSPNGNRLLRTKSLTVTTGGTVNLNDNDLIVDYDGASIESDIRQLVRDGRIQSTPGGEDDTALAIVDNAEWNKSSFNGESIDTSTIVGKYTYFGDANLDGKVTGDDYLNVDANLGTGDSWITGDFNMSGVTTGDDYLAIDANLGKGTTNPLAFAELKAEMVALHVEMFGEGYLTKLAHAEAHGFALVPEPASLALLALGATLLSRRRR